MAKNNKKNIKTDKITQEISELFNKLSETDYEMFNTNTPPDKWHIDKVMFLINKHIAKYDLLNNPPSVADRHYHIASALHNLGLYSITITHAFSATYIGYTQECFSWKFDGQEFKPNKEKDNTVEIIKALLKDEAKEKKPYYFIQSFDVINQRTISIYEQRKSIYRLFNEIFHAFKKVKKYDTVEEGPKKEKLLNQIIFSLLNLIPFILFEFEYLSLTRKNTRYQNETINNVAWSNNGLKTSLKVNALFKKPTIRMNTISAFSTEHENAQS